MPPSIEVPPNKRTHTDFREAFGSQLPPKKTRPKREYLDPYSAGTQSGTKAQSDAKKHKPLSSVPSSQSTGEQAQPMYHSLAAYPSAQQNTPDVSNPSGHQSPLSLGTTQQTYDTAAQVASTCLPSSTNSAHSSAPNPSEHHNALSSGTSQQTNDTAHALVPATKSTQQASCEDTDSTKRRRSVSVMPPPLALRFFRERASFPEPRKVDATSNHSTSTLKKLKVEGMVDVPVFAFKEADRFDRYIEVLENRLREDDMRLRLRGYPNASDNEVEAAFARQFGPMSEYDVISDPFIAVHSEGDLMNCWRNGPVKAVRFSGYHLFGIDIRTYDQPPLPRRERLKNKAKTDFATKVGPIILHITEGKGHR
ncbi:uncharacterized protein FOMMEDRAFT_32514, partial [Fomitiporia mediterranea MF3/22]